MSDEHEVTTCPTTPDGARPTVWVDTQVMAEIYSKGDLYKDEHRGAAIVQGRRMLLQGSLWFAMALDEQSTVTISYGNEALNTIKRIAPVGTEVGAWTAEAAHYLRPNVMPNWRPLRTDEDATLPTGKTGNNARDLHMVTLVKAWGLQLVTRDQDGKHGQPSPFELASQRGIQVMTPEQYAVAVLSRAAARDRFLSRMHRYVEAENATWARRSLEFHQAVWESMPRWRGRAAYWLGAELVQVGPVFEVEAESERAAKMLIAQQTQRERVKRVDVRAPVRRGEFLRARLRWEVDPVEDDLAADVTG